MRCWRRCTETMPPLSATCGNLPARARGFRRATLRFGAKTSEIAAAVAHGDGQGALTLLAGIPDFQDVGSLFARGRAHLLVKDYAAAEPEFRKALLESRGFSNFFFMRGQIPLFAAAHPLLPGPIVRRLRGKGSRRSTNTSLSYLTSKVLAPSWRRWPKPALPSSGWCTSRYPARTFHSGWLASSTAMPLCSSHTRSGVAGDSGHRIRRPGSAGRSARSWSSHIRREAALRLFLGGL